MWSMNEPFRPAQTRTEVARQVTLDPLPLGDPRHVDLSPGQDTRDLRLLRQYVVEPAGWRGAVDLITRRHVHVTAAGIRFCPAKKRAKRQRPLIGEGTRRC
jgi:hypothetical protein